MAVISNELPRVQKARLAAGFFIAFMGKGSEMKDSYSAALSMALNRVLSPASLIELGGPYVDRQYFNQLNTYTRVDWRVCIRKYLAARQSRGEPGYTRHDLSVCLVGDRELDRERFNHMLVVNACSTGGTVLFSAPPDCGWEERFADSGYWFDSKVSHRLQRRIFGMSRKFPYHAPCIFKSHGWGTK